MLEWCRRDDFQLLLPVLLEGEDPEFNTYIRALAASDAAQRRPAVAELLS